MAALLSRRVRVTLLYYSHTVISLVFIYSLLISCLPSCVGADVPETEAGSGTGEVTSRAGALQEVFDAAADTMAERQPLQGLPSQVTLIT